MLDIVVREVRRRKHESDAQGRKRQRQVDIAALKSPTFDNAQYFIDPDIMRMPDIDRLVGELRVAYPRSVHAQDRWEGDMLIAEDPVHLGMFNYWAVGLRGIAVVDLRYACTNGTSGICISYNKYASRRRVLHQTPAFVDKYPLLSVVIQRRTPEWQHVDADRLSEIKHRFCWQIITCCRAFGLVYQRGIFRPPCSFVCWYQVFLYRENWPCCRLDCCEVCFSIGCL